MRMNVTFVNSDERMDILSSKSNDCEDTHTVVFEGRASLPLIQIPRNTILLGEPIELHHDVVSVQLDSKLPHNFIVVGNNRDKSVAFNRLILKSLDSSNVDFRLLGQFCDLEDSIYNDKICFSDEDICKELVTVWQEFTLRKNNDGKYSPIVIFINNPYASSVLMRIFNDERVPLPDCVQFDDSLPTSMSSLFRIISQSGFTQNIHVIISGDMVSNVMDLLRYGRLLSLFQTQVFFDLSSQESDNYLGMGVNCNQLSNMAYVVDQRRIPLLFKMYEVKE